MKNKTIKKIVKPIKNSKKFKKTINFKNIKYLKKTIKNTPKKNEMIGGGFKFKEKIINNEENGILAFSINKDGNIIYSLENNEIHLHNNPKILNAHKNTVFSVSYSNNGSKIASGGQDQYILISDQKGNEIKQLEITSKEPQVIISLSWSNDETNFACLSLEGKVLLGNIAEKTIEKTLDNTIFFTALKYSNDVQNMIAAGGYKTLENNSESHNIYIYNFPIDDNVKILKGHTDKIIGVSWSPDNSMLVSASEDNYIIIWSIETALELTRINANSINSISWSPSLISNLIATTDEDNIKILRLDNSNETFILIRINIFIKKNVSSILWGKKGKILGCLSNRSILLYELKDEELIINKEENKKKIREIATLFLKLFKTQLVSKPIEIPDAFFKRIHFYEKKDGEDTKYEKQTSIKKEQFNSDDLRLNLYITNFLLLFWLSQKSKINKLFNLYFFLINKQKLLQQIAAKPLPPPVAAKPKPPQDSGKPTLNTSSLISNENLQLFFKEIDNNENENNPVLIKLISNSLEQLDLNRNIPSKQIKIIKIVFHGLMTTNISRLKDDTILIFGTPLNKVSFSQPQINDLIKIMLGNLKKQINLQEKQNIYNILTILFKDCFKDCQIYLPGQLYLNLKVGINETNTQNRINSFFGFKTYDIQNNENKIDETTIYDDDLKSFTKSGQYNYTDLSNLIDHFSNKEKNKLKIIFVKCCRLCNHSAVSDFDIEKMYQFEKILKILNFSIASIMSDNKDNNNIFQDTQICKSLDPEISFPKKMEENRLLNTKINGKSYRRSNLIYNKTLSPTDLSYNDTNLLYSDTNLLI